MAAATVGDVFEALTYCEQRRDYWARECAYCLTDGYLDPARAAARNMAIWGDRVSPVLDVLTAMNLAARA